MLPGDHPPGVVARTHDSASHSPGQQTPVTAPVSPALQSTVDRLRTVLTDYRDELTQAADAFEAWEQRWDEKQREIDAHLEFIQSRLKSRESGPSLSVVRADE